MSGEGSGHDWWHVYRVWQLAKRIGKTETTADMYIVELGALLHDIADWKFHGSLDAGPKAVREWLSSLNEPEDVINRVAYIARETSYKGARVKHMRDTIEAKIVSDADKLDALGAIGIARAFAYGGHKDRPLYEPDQPPVMHQTFEQYKNSKGHTINHFHEKLLLLKDRMETKTGKQLAHVRHDYMLAFLREFHDEWNGKV